MQLISLGRRDTIQAFALLTVITAYRDRGGCGRQPPERGGQSLRADLESGNLGFTLAIPFDCPHVLAANDPDSLFAVVTTKRMLH